MQNLHTWSCLFFSKQKIILNYLTSTVQTVKTTISVFVGFVKGASNNLALKKIIKRIILFVPVDWNRTSDLLVVNETLFHELPGV